MKARVIQDAIVITAAHIIEGETVLETTCNDFDAFCALPAAVEFEGRVCGKTGWSSDTGRAFVRDLFRHAVGGNPQVQQIIANDG